MTTRFIVAVLFLVARVARATLLIPVPDAALVRVSPVILVGQVSHIESEELRTHEIRTLVTLTVDQWIKGKTREHVTLTLPGGTVGGHFAMTFGAPEFTMGEHVLAFLKRTAGRRLRVFGLSLGVYRVRHLPDGRPMLLRKLPTTDLRDGRGMLDAIRALIAPEDVDAPQPDGMVLPVAGEVIAHAVHEDFTYLTGTPHRWAGGVASFGLANLDPVLGADTSDAVRAAMNAWATAPGTALTFPPLVAVIPAKSIAGGTCDGKSTIQFEDPFGEVADMVNCSGVLGVGGICGSATTIAEGDVTINQDVAKCWGPVNLAEVLTHEIGHAIGLGHSTVPGSTMGAVANFDGRGAAIRDDDVLGVATLYPAGLPAPTTTTTVRSAISTTASTSSTTTSSTSSTTASRPAATTSTSSSLPAVTTTVPPMEALCPCGTHAFWGSRDDFLRCVRREANRLFAAGALTRSAAAYLKAQAGVSTCGGRRVTRCCLMAACRILPVESCTGRRISAGAGSCIPSPCR